MKKKRMLLLVLFIILFAFAGGLVLMFEWSDMQFVEEGSFTFKYGEHNVSHSLSDEELSTVKKIFDGKLLRRDNPSCGFTEDVSITFNDSQTFCIACDACPIVFWAQKNKYIMLTEDEAELLHNILEAHGFVFPCV